MKDDGSSERVAYVFPSVPFQQKCRTMFPAALGRSVWLTCATNRASSDSTHTPRFSTTKSLFAAHTSQGWLVDDGSGTHAPRVARAAASALTFTSSTPFRTYRTWTWPAHAVALWPTS